MQIFKKMAIAGLIIAELKNKIMTFSTELENWNCENYIQG